MVGAIKIFPGVWVWSCGDPCVTQRQSQGIAVLKCMPKKSNNIWSGKGARFSKNLSKCHFPEPRQFCESGESCLGTPLNHQWSQLIAPTHLSNTYYIMRGLGQKGSWCWLYFFIGMARFWFAMYLWALEDFHTSLTAGLLRLSAFLCQCIERTFDFL